jgi:hypothetical protein
MKSLKPNPCADCQDPRTIAEPLVWVGPQVPHLKLASRSTHTGHPVGPTSRRAPQFVGHMDIRSQPFGRFAHVEVRATLKARHRESGRIRK